MFVQRYKIRLDEERKAALTSLIKKHQHHQITPEIRRELFVAPSNTPINATAMSL
jgi:hypothetical protein